MIEIKASTSQPLDCPKCKAKHGYKVNHRIQKYLELVYDRKGNDDGAIYSEHDKVLHVQKRAICANCNTMLPFNVRM